MILTPTEHDVPLESDVPIEVLIKEARQKSRRRRLKWIMLVVVALIATAALVLVVRVTSPSRRASPTGTLSNELANAKAATFVTPRNPYAMAVSPSGSLYVVDNTRDQILRETASGKFRVVAGDEHRGLSGDGGLAVNAKINVDVNSGLVVAKNGTLYFADTLNGRVREILPSGVIQTVVGGGTKHIGTGKLPAHDVSLSKVDTVNDVAIGPNGDLYVAAGAVYRVRPNGVLQWVVGGSSFPKNWGGVYSNPGAQYDFFQPDRIAFDEKGDLLVASGGGWGLYERTVSGKLRFLENFRGDGDFGSLSPAPNGTVILASRFGLFRFSPSSRITSISGDGKSLNDALGRMNIGSLENTFIGGDGVAVAPNGAIYVDTNAGNAFTSVTAILEFTTHGNVKTVWRS